MPPGRVIIFSGPSGVGKDTVLDAVIARDPRVFRWTTCTTRDPRPGEVNGVDYHFLDLTTFMDRAEHGDFLEFKEVYGRWYATPLAGLSDACEAGRFPVLKIDTQGALEAMVKLPDALTIFLMPPSDEELARRLRGRGTEDAEDVAVRLRTALSELAEAHRYSFQIVNDTVEDSVARFLAILRGDGYPDPR